MRDSEIPQILGNWMHMHTITIIPASSVWATEGGEGACNFSAIWVIINDLFLLLGIIIYITPI